jgi:hypothetical protein
MPRPRLTSAKSSRSRVILPGILTEIVRQRWKEFRYPGFSPFGLELICFDLRLRVPHEVTFRLAQEAEPVQDAIDRELYRQYRKGGERNGLLVQAVHGQIQAGGRAAPRGQFTSFQDHIRYSDALAPCIETRWQELGYAAFSDYVTALLRYDLLLLGPHNYFNGDDTGPEILAALDRETVREFHENRQPKRIYLDHLLEQAAGRPLTPEELRSRKLAVAEQIIQHALEADAQERSRQGR